MVESKISVKFLFGVTLIGGGTPIRKFLRSKLPGMGWVIIDHLKPHKQGWIYIVTLVASAHNGLRM